MKYILEGVNSILSDKEECINHQTKKEKTDEGQTYTILEKFQKLRISQGPSAPPPSQATLMPSALPCLAPSAPSPHLLQAPGWLI